MIGNATWFQLMNQHMITISSAADYGIPWSEMIFVVLSILLLLIFMYSNQIHRLK